MSEMMAKIIELKIRMPPPSSRNIDDSHAIRGGNSVLYAPETHQLRMLEASVTT